MAHEVVEAVLPDSVTNAAVEAAAAATAASAAAGETVDSSEAQPPETEVADSSMVESDPQQPELITDAPKVNDEAVHEVAALTDESAKHALEAATGTVAASTVPVTDAIMSSVPVTVSGTPTSTPLPMTVNIALGAMQETALPKEEEAMHRPEEVQLVEVAEAMIAANDVFNRVKSEKIAEQALCSIRNDQQQYEGLAKEIVGKAIKQKERERANRASAAASRAKVMRYQTELESRLNRMEAERNAYRRELNELRNSTDGTRKLQPDEVKQLAKLQDWIRKMEAANPQFVRSVIAQGEMDKLLGEDMHVEDKLDMVVDIKEEENAAKRRRL